MRYVVLRRGKRRHFHVLQGVCLAQLVLVHHCYVVRVVYIRELFSSLYPRIVHRKPSAPSSARTPLEPNSQLGRTGKEPRHNPVFRQIQ